MGKIFMIIQHPSIIDFDVFLWPDQALFSKSERGASFAFLAFCFLEGADRFLQATLEKA